MSFPENLENINIKGEMYIIRNSTLSDNRSIFAIYLFHLIFHFIKILPYIISSLCFIAYGDESLNFENI